MSEDSDGVITAELTDTTVLAPANDATREHYEKGRYGEPVKPDQFQYSLVEALYLLERGKMQVIHKGQIMDFPSLLAFAQEQGEQFWVRYQAFKDMRNRGYIVKTALKFGADFRVYDRGVKPGDDHAKWVMFPIAESSSCSWFEFAAKNRVAHSTRKRLLLAIVDDEGACTYYAVTWTRP